MERHLIEKKECSGYVSKIIKSSIVDGFGNRIAIFMQGCNFDCRYCHNPETIESYIGSVYTPKSLYDEVSKYFSFIDGITFSGGEPLLQQDFLIEFVKLLRKDIHVLIDSNGSVIIKQQLVELVDGFMLDVKCLCDKEHKRLTKFSNKQVLKNLSMLNSCNKLYEVRTVVYPSYDNSATIDFVKNTVSKNVRYLQIPYHDHGVRDEFKGSI